MDSTIIQFEEQTVSALARQKGGLCEACAGKRFSVLNFSLLRFFCFKTKEMKNTIEQGLSPVLCRRPLEKKNQQRLEIEGKVAM